MKTYLIIHSHNFGNSVYLFKSEAPYDVVLNNIEDKVVKQLGIDYDCDADEFLELSEMEDIDFPVLYLK